MFPPDRNSSPTFESRGAGERNQSAPPQTAMATVFTQDSVLHFLQSSGGAVKNADLISHFRNFVRDHGDQRRNRELFKQFVNSVAIVKQIDGVSHVVLKKKFRGHVPGTGRAESPAGRREEPPAGRRAELPASRREEPPAGRRPEPPAGRGVPPAGRNAEPPAGRRAEPPVGSRAEPPASDRNRNPAGSADTTRPQRREDAEPAPPRETRRKPFSEHEGVSGIQEGAHQPPVTQAEAMPPPLGSNPKASWHLSAGNLSQEPGPPALHRSTDHIYAEEQFSARGAPLHYSTGDLYDDYEDAESSDGSASSPQLRQRPAAAGRLSGRLRSRMCRSMGADLDQLLQEESRRGGGEAARLERLHQLSSSLSLHHHLSSSSLSSCATPPRCPSPAPVVDGQEMGEKRRSHSTTMHHGGQQLVLSGDRVSNRNTSDGGLCPQSQVPLDPREHDWMVKGAAGAWPDIYSLFREDASLLNRRDFICGFTVLHWIAKHGDHRVLNTL
ncbi:unnamed protein product, partial [Menidia menidia]